MRVLLTGACGFVGSSLVAAAREHGAPLSFLGADSLVRDGSERNRQLLRRLGVPVRHLDVRSPSDFEDLPEVDFVVDAAALPSVLSGTAGHASSRLLVEHNLIGTVNVLEFCRRRSAGLVLLSTSRVYSIPELERVPLVEGDGAFRVADGAPLPPGASGRGLSEEFSTAPPVSLYGATKRAGEVLALEYGSAFSFPVWVDRCGVLAGAGQFGRPDQGIFSYWIHSWCRRQPLRYVGFGGTGLQVRDCLHPADLFPLVLKQLQAGSGGGDRPRVVNVSGGLASATSLRQLSSWCEDRLGPHEVGIEPASRPFDVPWMVLDPGLAETAWGFRPTRTAPEVFEEIARHAEESPDWLSLSDPG